MPDTVTFTFEGETLRFNASGANDHIVRVMQRLGTFYEHDVLARIRERLSAMHRAGAAVDAGGFIGTHSVFFAKFCGTRPVLTFEANPLTFRVLRGNLDANAVGNTVVPVNSALGSVVGEGHVVAGPVGNLGMSKVVPGRGPGVSVPVTTIDAEVERAGVGEVALIKIDVEGAEIDVLEGARRVLASYKPLLCIEVHDARRLASVLGRLAHPGYLIVDCLGYSPTYVLEAVETSSARRAAVNALWLARATLPATCTRARSVLRRLAHVVSGRSWAPPIVRTREGTGERATKTAS